MSKRLEFSLRTKQQAFTRSNGVCECGCGQPFTNHPKERPHYDHRVPAYLGGSNDLSNCRVVRVCCHQSKTRDTDMPMIVKARREIKRRYGLTPRKRLIPGSVGSGLRNRMDGTVLKVQE